MNRALLPWLKWAGLALAVGSILVAVILSWLANPKDSDTDPGTVEQQQSSVESPILVERKDGKIVWQLRAAEASQQLDGTMLMTTPTLTLYTDSGKEVAIEGKQASFDPLRRDVTFHEAVQVHHEQWLLKTEEMTYLNAKDMLLILGEFEIQGETIQARGKNMKMFRTSEEIQVNQGVWIRDNNANWQTQKGATR